MRLDTKEKRAAARQAWIKGAKTELYKDIEILITERQQGRYTLAIFKGTEGKPSTYYSFKDLNRLHDHVDQVKQAADRREIRKADHIKQKKASKFSALLCNDLKRGDLFVTSWGYDQTNYDYICIMSISASGKTAQCRRDQ